MEGCAAGRNESILHGRGETARHLQRDEGVPDLRRPEARRAGDLLPLWQRVLARQRQRERERKRRGEDEVRQRLRPILRAVLATESTSVSYTSLHTTLRITRECKALRQARRGPVVCNQ